jgi:phytanoyl-CoA hydroxylase
METTEALRKEGYVLVPQLVPPRALKELNETAHVQLRERDQPLELEADLRYPGAPQSRDDAGGGTVRRLLDAYARDGAFAAWAVAPAVREWMDVYFGERVLMSRAHHNCLMTKHPQYGSLTGWHRDIRYWSFQREDLVSVWFALGEETIENGALWLVPGSHKMTFETDRFDEAKFFRDDHPANREIIRAAVSPRLAPGDALFFHCNTLHSAGRNLSDSVKFSLVYTYHGESNAPRAGTRSASKPEVEL